MKNKTERKFIIVDEHNRPMSFSGDQLCYVNPRGRSRFYLEIYTEEQAKEKIAKTISFRERYGFSIDEYNLMPIK